MRKEDYEPERRKDYPILYAQLKVITDDIQERKNEWRFLGFTAKEIVKYMGAIIVAVWYGAGMYNKLEAYEADTKRLLICDKNRDQWATAKYGHPFECGRPTDGWEPNFGTVTTK